MKKNRGAFIGGLIILFLIIVLIGRFYFSPKTIINNDVYSPPSEVGTDTSAFSVKNDASANNNAIAPHPSTTTPGSSCPEALQAEVVAKKQSYAKGQILVTFNPDQVYKNVKDVLAVYGLVVQNEIESQSSFASRHLVTAAVAPGQEMIKVCQLRSDAHIKYAGLDLYFNIHQ